MDTINIDIVRSDKLKLIDMERIDGGATLIENYACDIIIECDGTSIWEDTAGKKVHVTAMTIISDEYGDKTVNVTHDAAWTIYTDRGFEKGISELLGEPTTFTEQGMQEDNFASMEC